MMILSKNENCRIGSILVVLSMLFLSMTIDVLAQSLGGTTAVTIIDNRAYVGENGSLLILDVTDPTNPTQLSKTLVVDADNGAPDEIHDIKIVDNLAYISNNDNGLIIMNVSNVVSPTVVGVHRPPAWETFNIGSTLEVEVGDSVAYIANLWGYDVVDVSDPTNPTTLFQLDALPLLDPFGLVQSVEMVGDVAYFIDTENGVYRVDGSESRPEHVFEFGTAKDIEIVDNLAYIAASGSGLYILDMGDFTDPSTATLLGNHTASVAHHVQVDGNVAYVVGQEFLVFDVSEPSAPTLLHTYTTGEVEDFEVVGNIAYIAEGKNGLRIVDVNLDTVGVNDNSVPPILSNYSSTLSLTVTVTDTATVTDTVDVETEPAATVPIVDPFTLGGTTAVTIIDNYAYVGESGSLLILDVTEPANPTLLSKTLVADRQTPDEIHDIKIIDNLAYIANADNGLTIMDVSNVISPTIVGGYQYLDVGNQSTYDVEVVDSTAYLANKAGYVILDVSDPANPILLNNDDNDYNYPSFFSYYGSILSVDVYNNFPFFTDTNDGVYSVNYFTVVDSNESYYDGVLVHRFGDAKDIEIVDDLAYVAGNKGLRILDMTDDTVDTFLGFHAAAGAHDVEVHGNIAYVAGAVLSVFDVSDSSNPTLLGSFTTGEIEDFAVVGDVAYIANGENGLRVIDVSNPPPSPLLGTYNSDSGNVIDVQIVDQIAYVTDQYAGLITVDVSDPTNPTELRMFGRGQAYDTHVVDNVAYTAHKEGVMLFDVSDPTRLPMLSTYETDRPVYAVAYANDTVYAFMSDQFFILDVTDPAAPTLQGTVAIEDTYHDRINGDIQIVGDIAYVVDADYGLLIFDVSDSTNPTLLTVYEIFQDSWYIGFERAVRVDVRGNLAYVALPSNPVGIVVLDVSDPTNPTVASGYDVGYSTGFHVTENDIYVTTGQGLHFANREQYFIDGEMWPTANMLDQSDSLMPPLFGLKNGGRNVQVVDNIAYVAGSTDGLVLLDVSNDNTPPLIASYSSVEAAVPRINRITNFMGETNSTSSSFLDEDGETAYVSHDGELMILDVTDTAQPIVQSTLSITETHSSINADDYWIMEVVDGVAYLMSDASSDMGNELITVAITDPESPTVLGAYPISGTVNNIDVIENVAYMANSEALLILDVSDPAQPTQMGRFVPEMLDGEFYSSLVNDVQVTDNVAYLALPENILMVLDVTDPANPIQLGRLAGDEDSSRQLHVVDNIVYVTGGEELAIVDVTTPTTPTLLSTFHSPGSNIQVVDGIAYMSDYRHGLVAVDVSDPTTPVWLGFSPIWISFQPMNADYIQVVSDTIYVAHQYYGLFAIEENEPLSESSVPLVVGMSMVQATGALPSFVLFGFIALVVLTQGCVWKPKSGYARRTA